MIFYTTLMLWKRLMSGLTNVPSREELSDRIRNALIEGPLSPMQIDTRMGGLSQYFKKERFYSTLDRLAEEGRVVWLSIKTGELYDDVPHDERVYALNKYYFFGYD